MPATGYIQKTATALAVAAGYVQRTAAVAPRPLNGRLLAGVVRRFCACGGRSRCVCGLPHAVSGWSIERLTELRQLMRDHGDLDVVAMLLGETRHECNRALNALLGRTPAHALAALEAAAARS